MRSPCPPTHHDFHPAWWAVCLVEIMRFVHPQYLIELGSYRNRSQIMWLFSLVPEVYLYSPDLRPLESADIKWSVMSLISRLSVLRSSLAVLSISALQSSVRQWARNRSLSQCQTQNCPLHSLLFIRLCKVNNF